MLSSIRLAQGYGEEQPLKIRLDTHVTKIAVTNDDMQATVTTHTNEALICSAVVVTVPLGILKSDIIEFDPPLPRPKLEALRNFG